MDKLKNDNIDYTQEDIRYFVDRYLQGIKLNDVTALKSQIADEMSRTKGSINWKVKHALWFLTNGEQGKPNGPKYLEQYLTEYREEHNMSLAKMIYWFE